MATSRRATSCSTGPANRCLPILASRASSAIKRARPVGRRATPTRHGGAVGRPCEPTSMAWPRSASARSPAVPPYGDSESDAMVARPLGPLAPDAPAALVAAIEAGLDPDPAARPDAAAFGRALFASCSPVAVALRGRASRWVQRPHRRPQVTAGSVRRVDSSARSLGRRRRRAFVASRAVGRHRWAAGRRVLIGRVFAVACVVGAARRGRRHRDRLGMGRPRSSRTGEPRDRARQIRRAPRARWPRPPRNLHLRLCSRLPVRRRQGSAPHRRRPTRRLAVSHGWARPEPRQRLRRCRRERTRRDLRAGLAGSGDRSRDAGAPCR